MPSREESDETFVQLCQRVSLGALLPKAATRRQFRELRAAKLALLQRLTKFYQVLDAEARLQALQTEFSKAKELHTVLLRQNIVLVDHGAKLEEDLATSKQRIAQKQQAVGSFRRACEELT